MKKILVAILLLTAGTVYAQRSTLPKFKANASKTDNPFTSIKSYELILGCRAYNNASHEIAFNVLVLKDGHWKKFTYKAPVKNALFEVADPPLKEVPTSDAECMALFNKMVAADVFDLKEEAKLPKCDVTLEEINGDKQRVSHSIEDGPEYRIWLVAPSKVRYLSYYAPEYFQKFCPDDKDRQNVVKIVEAFTQGW